MDIIILVVVSGIISLVQSRILKWEKDLTLLAMFTACMSWAGYIGLEIYFLITGNNTCIIYLSAAVLFINSVILVLIVIEYRISEDISWALFQQSVVVWPTYLAL